MSPSSSWSELRLRLHVVFSETQGPVRCRLWAELTLNHMITMIKAE